MPTYKQTFATHQTELTKKIGGKKKQHMDFCIELQKDTICSTTRLESVPVAHHDTANHRLVSK